jgi:chaperonin GroEL
VIVEDSPTAETSLKVIEGTKIDAGYASHDFVPDGDIKTTLDNAYVFVSLEPISALKGMVDLLDKVVKTERPLFILAENITGEALKTIIINHKRGNLLSCVVKGSGVGDKKREAMQDIAVLTGATPFSFDLGKDLGHFILEDLGQAKKITISNKDTLIIGGKGSSENVEARINQIKIEMEKTWSEFDKERYQDRLGRLAGGIAIISVGACTESELREKKARVEDALNATQAAAGLGISPGGGIALLRASSYLLSRLEEIQEDYVPGFKIMIKALQSPIKTLLSNAYLESPMIIQNITGTEIGYDYGYNVQTNQYQNFYESGIVDPTKVVISTIQNSASISGVTLTTAAGIANLI